MLIFMNWIFSEVLLKLKILIYPPYLIVSNFDLEIFL